MCESKVSRLRPDDSSTLWPLRLEQAVAELLRARVGAGTSCNPVRGIVRGAYSTTRSLPITILLRMRLCPACCSSVDGCSRIRASGRRRQTARSVWRVVSPASRMVARQRALLLPLFLCGVCVQRWERSNPEMGVVCEGEGTTAMMA